MPDRFWFLLAGALLPLLLMSAPGREGAPAAEPIRIGHVDALTGVDGPYGNLVDRGIRLAVEEINSKGGVNGRRLELFSLDDQGKSSEAVLAVTKLITSHRVAAILGESTSSKSLAIAPLAQQYKIPMISPGATNVKVTQTGDYVFRICYVDSYQGALLAKFVWDKLKLKRVAIFRDLNSDASIGVSNFFTREFTAKGGKVVSDQTYTAGDLEFRPQLVAIKQANPEALFLSGYYAEAGLIARQAREQGLKIPLFGSDAWDSPSLPKIGGPALEGSYFATHYLPESPSPEVRGFIKRYQAKYPEVPPTGVALGYDAAKILADAMKSLTVITPTGIRDALARTKDFPGVTGKITINNERNAVTPAFVMQIRDGKFRYYGTIE